VSSISVSLLVTTAPAEILADANVLTIAVVALGVVGGIAALLYRYSRSRAERGEEEVTAISKTISYSHMATQSGITSHLIPILAAAAAAAIGRRVVIRRITFINRDTVSGWAVAGRTSIQLSHNLRRTM
jgi:hypothetical protein